AGEGGGREVLVRTLSRRFAPAHEGSSGSRGDAGRDACTLQTEGAMARLPHLLCRRLRGWLGCAEEVYRTCRGGGFQEVSNRGRALQVCLLYPWPRVGVRGIRGLLAQGPHHQAIGVQSSPR